MGRHHVTMWLSDRGLHTSDSDSDATLISKCKSVPVEVNIKVIISEELHHKCKKARIRFTKEAAEELARKEDPSVSDVSSEVQSTSSSVEQETLPMETNCDADQSRESSGGTNLTNTQSEGTSEEPSVEDSEDLLSLSRETVSDDNKKNTSLTIDIFDDDPFEPTHVEPEEPMNIIKTEIVDQVKSDEQKVCIDQNSKPLPNVLEDPKDLSEARKKSKLSLQEYKLRENRRLAEARRLEAPELTILGQRKVPISSREPKTYPEKKVKKEEPEDPELTSPTVPATAPEPLQSVRQEQAEPQAEVPQEASETNVEKIFKRKVRDYVNEILLCYYDNGKDREKKIIKIKDQAEFTRYCSQLSHKFREEIQEAYFIMNRSLEGIERINVREYSIDHDIQRLFEDLPTLN